MIQRVLRVPTRIHRLPRCNIHTPRFVSHKPPRTTSTSSSEPTERVSLPQWFRLSPSEILVYGLGIALAGHIFFNYCFTITPCYGISMLPTFNSFGDSVVVSKYYRQGRGIQVGDIVSYTHPVEREVTAMKRVIGMPGDFVQRDTPGGESGMMLQARPYKRCIVSRKRLIEFVIRFQRDIVGWWEITSSTPATLVYLDLYRWP
jgi:signal peptidase I